MPLAGERHLRAVRNAWHYNQHRPHRARNSVLAARREASAGAISDLAAAPVGRQRVLGGVINKYKRALSDQQKFTEKSQLSGRGRILKPRRLPRSPYPATAQYTVSGARSALRGPAANRRISFSPW